MAIADQGARHCPPDAAAPREAQAFLFKAGASDIFEIVTGQMAVQHSANPAVEAKGRDNAIYL